MSGAALDVFVQKLGLLYLKCVSPLGVSSTTAKSVLLEVGRS